MRNERFIEVAHALTKGGFATICGEGLTFEQYEILASLLRGQVAAMQIPEFVAGDWHNTVLMGRLQPQEAKGIKSWPTLSNPRLQS